MITKEELKKEVDKLPDDLLDEVFSLLQQVLRQTKDSTKNMSTQAWGNWKKNLEQFSPDFMNDRNQSSNQSRESFD
ncbi:MAG TPA: hypothetical protein VIN08_17620 [Ohtaekwangia sp.]|uniref:hypothetical protein n=1 Tax=Ohtaekwangia sp. TaxID=2066019 RepID=UPI002F950DAD